MSKAKEIAQFINDNDHFLLTTHVFPDGDNMGSVLSLADALIQLGKDFTAYIEGPIPKIFEWMPHINTIHTEIDDSIARLNGNSDTPILLVVDSADIHRIGDHFEVWLQSRNGGEALKIVNIDHHISNTNFGTINWVDSGYSSVGEMVYEILKELDVEITPEIAQNLFTSVYTDTGRFSFSNTTEKSLRYAAEYIAAGALPYKSFHGVYASRSMASFQLQNLSNQTLTKFLDGRGYIFWVDQNMLMETGTTMEDTEGFIDTVRTLRGFDLVVFMKEVSPSDIRVSVRAAPPINASFLMKKFGGGGHPRAAGCRMKMPLQQAIQHFMELSEEAINSGEVLEKENQDTTGTRV
jgi:phosphoesterase RecJ-like protein